MNGMAIMMLLASGGDVPAPAELRNILINDPDTEKFKLEGTDEEKLEAVKGFIATNLRPSQLMGLHDFIHNVVVKTISYVAEHPEYKESLETEEAFKRFNSTMDTFKKVKHSLEKSMESIMGKVPSNKDDDSDEFNLS